MIEATRRLLDTLNVIKDTENHRKMLEMSRRVENLMNDAKMEIKTQTTVMRGKMRGGGGVIVPPHLILLKIGMRRQ